MERDLSAGVVARLGDRVVYPALFYEGVFWSASLGTEQTLNLWSGLGSFAWDGKTWLGAGNLLGCSPIEESDEIRAIGFTISLAGQNSQNISLVKQGTRQGKPGKIWLGLLTAAGVLADEPYLLKRGKLDVAVIDDEGELCKISVNYEDRLIDLERSRERRYTSADQQLDYPADLGFDQVAALQNLDLPWGQVDWGARNAAAARAAERE